MIPENIIRDSVRSIIRWKYRSLVSIFSLGIGIASLVVVLHIYYSERSFDKHFDDADRIYRLVYTDPLNAAKRSYLPGVLYNSISTRFSQVESMGRMILRSGTMEYDNESPRIYPLLIGDPELFKILSVNIIQGNRDLLNNPANSVYISESISRKLFGENNAIGEMLKLDNEDFIVMAVFEDFPENTHFSAGIILSTESIAGDRILTDFNISASYYYVKLYDQELSSGFESEINSFVRSLLGLPDNISPVSVQKLVDIYLDSDDIQQGQIRSGNRQLVSILPWVALLLIIVSVCNHLIMDAERSFSILKVNYLRRIFGEKNISVALRYYMDSILYTLISVILAAGLVALFLDLKLLETDQSLIEYLKKSFLWMFLVILVFPLIPALLNTFSFRSITNSKIFRINSTGFSGNQEKDRSKALSLRSFIVLVQVLISIVLSISSITAYRQVKHVEKMDYGFEIDNLLVLDNHTGTELTRKKRYNIFKEIAVDNTLIEAFASASNYPFSDLNNYTQVRKEGQIEEENLSSAFVGVDQDFFNTLEIKLLQGRVFDPELASDISNSVIINSRLSQGLEGNILSENLRGFWVDKTKRVIGVIPDVQFGNIRSNIDMMSFVIESDYMTNNQYLFFRIKEGTFENVYSLLREEWFKNEPHEAFEAFMLDDILKSQVSREKLISIVLLISTMISYLLSVMGIISVAEWISRKKSKEIAIRRINGALMVNILRSSYRELYLPVAAAIILALPAVYLALNEWLSGFVYRVNVSILNLLMGVFFVVLSLFIIMLINTYLIFCRNPVENLSRDL